MAIVHLVSFTKPIFFIGIQFSYNLSNVNLLLTNFLDEACYEYTIQLKSWLQDWEIKQGKVETESTFHQQSTLKNWFGLVPVVEKLISELKKDVNFKTTNVEKT